MPRGGRPSIDPELMIRMLLVGYAFAIRSERRLCEEVHLNLALAQILNLGRLQAFGGEDDTVKKIPSLEKYSRASF